MRRTLFTTAILALCCALFAVSTIPSRADDTKTIDVEAELKKYLDKNEGLLDNDDSGLRKLKDKLNDPNWVLHSIEFKGDAATDGMEYQWPKGVTFKDGELHFDDKDNFAKPDTLAHALARNHGDDPQTVVVELKSTTTKEETWENSISIGIGVKFKEGTLFSGSQQSISFEYDFTKKTMKGTETEWDEKPEIETPGRSQIPVTLTVKKLSLDIPYSLKAYLSGKTVAHFTPKKEGVEVYEDTDYGGRHHFFKAGKHKKTTYDSHDFKKHDFDDKTSSLKVFGNIEVKYYDNSNCKDLRGTTSSDVKWVGKHNNDEISCIEIYRKGTEEVTFDLEKALDKKHRTFSMEGVWSGVDAYDGIVDIGRATPLNDEPATTMKHGRLKDRTKTVHIKPKKVKKLY